MGSKFRYFMTLSYDGTDFVGWQIQPLGRTVQGLLELALSTISREEVKVTGAGRTDTGVHARFTVAHFDLSIELDKESLSDMKEHLNRYLPSDISLYGLYRVHHDAHARFDAVARTYRYYVTLDKDPFTTKYETRLRGHFDFDAMNRAALHLVGTYDFTTFSKKHTDVKTHICTVTYARWIEQSPGKWYFEITADRFLRNMVRSIVGTLFMVGRGRMSEEEFRIALNAKDRSKASTTAPAEGLFLEEVKYAFPFES